MLNFRELSLKTNSRGLKLKRNTIYRSSAPHPAGGDILKKLDDHNIAYIYDLRSNLEIRKDGQEKVNRARTVHINVLPAAGMSDGDFEASLENASVFMNSLYRDMLSESREYSTLIREILNQKSPGFLFHCTAGKDRTGIAGVILMHLFQFSPEDIAQEYLTIDPDLIDFLSTKFMPDESVLKRSVPDLDLSEIRDKMLGFITVKEEYLNSFYSGIKERYGSMDAYIRDFLDIDSREVEELHRRYLIPS